MATTGTAVGTTPGTVGTGVGAAATAVATGFEVGAFGATLVIGLDEGAAETAVATGFGVGGKAVAIGWTALGAAVGADFTTVGALCTTVGTGAAPVPTVGRADATAGFGMPAARTVSDRAMKMASTRPVAERHLLGVIANLPSSRASGPEPMGGVTQFIFFCAEQATCQLRA